MPTVPDVDTDTPPRPVWPWLTLALLPFVASLAFASRTPAAAPMTTDRTEPSLQFEQYLVDYGSQPVVPRPIISVPFRYRNTGQDPIRIRALTPSCGCLQPKIDSMVIPPGQTGELTMPIQTANEKAGPHEYLVKIFYEDPKPHEVDLALKLVLPEKEVLVEPRAMWFFQSGARPTSQSVKITDFRTQRFEVLSIECTSELFSVRQTSDKPRLDGGREITLEVSTTGEIPPGRHRGIVVVETDDPRYPYIRIPVGCQPMDDQPATESAAPEPEPEPERGPQTP